MDLGDLSGEQEPLEEHTFMWFGHEVRVHPELCDSSYVDWVEEFGRLDIMDPKASLAVKRFLQVVVHPDDFESFWSEGRKHRRSQEQYMQVAHMLIEAVTDLPTERSSASPAGPSTTAASSTDASYERVIEQKESEGRPDLALVYVAAREAHAS